MATNATTDSETSSDDDIATQNLDDLFDDVTLMEEELVSIGKKEGSKHISKKAYIDGYETGRQHGSQLGFELGFYNGFVSLMLFSGKNGFDSIRYEKLLTKLHLTLSKLDLNEKTLANDDFMNTEVKLIRQNFKRLLQIILNNNSQFSNQLKQILTDSEDVPLAVKEFIHDKENINKHSKQIDPNDLIF